MENMSGGGWINSMPCEVQDLVRSNMRHRALADDEHLFTQGDDADALYEVVEGRIIINHHSVNGTETIITIFGKGDCVGEQGMIDDLPRANSAYARGLTEVLGIGKVRFEQLRRENHEITEALLRLISRRQRQLLVRLSEQTNLGVHARLARRIYSMAEPCTAKGSNIVDLDFCLSQGEFGRWVGYTRQRVNAAMGDLQRDGLITLSANRIRIEDVARLKSYARDHHV